MGYGYTKDRGGIAAWALGWYNAGTKRKRLEHPTLVP